MAAEIEPLDASLPAALEEPAAYARASASDALDGRVATGGVSHVQTHLSHVFLSDERVYKLHKAVDLGFVSFATQLERNLDCLREVELNRRLAPDVYLGVARVERSGAGWVLGEVVPRPATLGPGEHCVVMRRLPDGRDARSLLASGRLGPALIERLARRLAAFHRAEGLGRPSPYDAAEWLHRITRPVEANFESLLERSPGVVPEAEIVRLRELAREAARRLAPAFERRRVEGRAVDGHGDLHLDHVWFEDDDAQPLVIDCIAFDVALRCIDASSDMAFLAMDLGHRGRPDFAEQLLATYAAAADDFDLYRVIDYFISYRAAVRAKVAALECLDPAIPDAQRAEARARARRRIEFALAAFAPRAVGRVTLVGGVIGSGKTTAARAIAAETNAVVVSSDVVRRFVDPPSPERRPEARPEASWHEGRYAPAAIDDVYGAMLDRASAVIESGRDVVLDASWSRRDRRERARAWAQQRNAQPLFVEVRCPRDVALERLAERRARGTDASEAGPELYDAFASNFERLDEWPNDSHRIIDTSQRDWRDRLLPLARQSVEHT